MSRNNRIVMAAATAALIFGSVIAAGVVTGCRSKSPSSYIAPRVEGRVLDAKTRQPISGVTVQRMDPSAAAAPGDIPKGATAMEQAPKVRTGKDGAFALASERNLELFARARWYSVTIRFQHAGYAPFMTNYTPAHATRTPRGEPLVNAGDILLAPDSR